MAKGMSEILDRARTFVRDLLRTIPYVVWFLMRSVLSNRIARTNVNERIKDRVLVFATNAIGDTVLTLPALECVIENQRPLKVDVLARPKTAQLLKLIPGIGNVFTLEKLNFPFKVRALVSNISTLRRLRRTHYESAVIFSSNFWTAWVAFLVRARKRYGFSRLEKVGLVTIRDFGFLLTHDKGGIQSSNYLDAHYEFLDWLQVPYSEQNRLPRLNLGSVPTGVGSPRTVTEQVAVVLAPFSPQHVKEWPLAHWFELAEALAQQGISVVVSCEPSQKRRLDGAFANASAGVRVSSDLDVLAFIGLLKEATVVVTNDSGPLHLSYALGKPTVAIFGPTDPENIIPGGVDVTVVRRVIECSPCYHLGIYDRCPLTHHRCVKEIQTDEVLAPVLAYLGMSVSEGVIPPYRKPVQSRTSTSRIEIR